jgi:hypothetical protein
MTPLARKRSCRTMIKQPVYGVGTRVRSESHGLFAFDGTKINSSDPLTAVCTAYPTSPFLPFFHSPIELLDLMVGEIHI